MPQFAKTWESCKDSTALDFFGEWHLRFELVLEVLMLDHVQGYDVHVTFAVVEVVLLVC